MTQIALEEADVQLARLIREALRGEEVIITQNSQPVAKLVSIPSPEPKKKPRARFGSGKGLILYMAEDFDAPLEDFKEYME